MRICISQYLSSDYVSIILENCEVSLYLFCINLENNKNPKFSIHLVSLFSNYNSIYTAQVINKVYLFSRDSQLLLQMLAAFLFSEVA